MLESSGGTEVKVSGRVQNIHFCTADLGWVTGHSYIVYGPLSSGATSVLFESIPNYPDFSRFWNVVDDLKCTNIYTSPTALRALMRAPTLAAAVRFSSRVSHSR